MEKMCRVTINGTIETYAEGTPYMEAAARHQKDYPHAIILVKANGKLQELHKRIKKDCTLEFVTTADPIGMETYRRSVLFLMLKAVSDVYADGKCCPVRVENALSKGVFCMIKGEERVSTALLEQVEARMRELQKQELPIQKSTMRLEDARDMFRERKMQDKYDLFRFRMHSNVNIYSLGEYCDYFYGYMAANTRQLKWFSLFPYEDGFILQMPIAADPETVPEFHNQEKLFHTLTETRKWNEMMQISTVADLNNQIIEGRGNELILLQEALMEKKIGDIAEKVATREGVKFVLVAGPSSSGKTSFANRLAIQLRTQGMIPHIVSVDNYYKNREDIPKDEKGEYDFECLEALDVKQLNKDLKALLRGEEISMPRYNFGTGLREYKGATLTMGEHDVLVIEGIHCLNDALTYDIPKENKFKIYISALTQLNVDEHNRIATTDGRLLRRMARDARTRNTTAQETIRMWGSVRRGEERNIFPYQEDADVMFNSVLIYELSVLKDSCRPILYSVPQDSPEYLEAKRLLKFLDYFLGFSSDLIPHNSLVREFAGGSCFDV